MAVADALESLLHWHGVIKRAAWRHLADVRADFPHADAVDAFTVFNISGNKYRLVSVIKYHWQIVYIRHILTHAEYDKGRWKLRARRFSTNVGIESFSM
ncbi:MAG: type II toxin-antitoxin system HigB family toxin [Bryobacteraceae bacterium]